MTRYIKIYLITLVLVLASRCALAQDAFIYLRPYRTDIGATYADSITVVIGRPPGVTGLVKYHIWTKTAGGGEYSLFKSTYDDSLAFAASTPANYYVKVQTETVSYLGGRKTVILQDFNEAPERNIDINSYLNYFFNTSTGYLRASAIDADSITIGGGSIADTLRYYSRIDTLGDMAVEDLVQYAKLGTTIVSGGYLQTVLIDADYIRAGLIRSTVITADSITAGTLTGRTVRTAATGQRIVMNGPANTLVFYKSTGDSVVKIDDSANGYIYVGSTNDNVKIFDGNIQILNADGEAMSLNRGNAGIVLNIYGTESVAAASVFKVYGGGDVQIDKHPNDANGGDLTLSNGSIILSASETVDGIDVSAIPSTYAPIAKGVTNGDSHDHNGGDGAQINHTTLSNIGTNTHAQIDTHVGSTSNPHSVTGEQISGSTASDTDFTVITNLAISEDPPGTWTLYKFTRALTIENGIIAVVGAETGSPGTVVGSWTP